MCERAFETLSDEEIAFIQERMLPRNLETEEEKKMKRISVSGFLLPGESLREIYEVDRRFLENARITYDQIADVLTTVVGKACRKRHHHYKKTNDYWPTEGFLVDGRYQVKINTYAGAQECPFQDPTDTRYFGYQYGSSDVTVMDTKTRKQLVYNTLLPHM